MDVALELADLAAEQWGLVTAAQARAVGVSNQMAARLAAQGRLERLSYGVYRVAGATAGPLDGLRAAWLALEAGRRAAERVQDPTPAVVSHRTAAAAIYGYGDLDSDVYEFTVPGRRQSRRSDVRFHRATLERREWTVVDGLPVTTPTRTIVDLAAARIDGGHLAAVVRDAVTGYHVDEAELSERLRPYADKYGAPLGDGARLIEAFLEQTGAPVSPLAISAALEAAIRAAGPIDTSALTAVIAASNAPAMQSISRIIAQTMSPTMQAAIRAAGPIDTSALTAVIAARPSTMQAIQRVSEANTPLRAAAQANLPAIREAAQRVVAQNAPALDAARRRQAQIPNTPTTPGLAALVHGIDDDQVEDDRRDVNRDDHGNGGA